MKYKQFRLFIKIMCYTMTCQLKLMYRGDVHFLKTLKFLKKIDKEKMTPNNENDDNK